MTSDLKNAQQIFEYIQAEVQRTFNIELSRRDFIKLMSGGALGGLATGFKTNQAQAQDNSLGDSALFTTETMPNGIAVGDVSQTSAILWTRSIALGTVQFTVLDSENTVITQANAEVTDATIPVKVSIEGLNPASTYHYQVRDARDSVLEGQFRTLLAEGHSGLRFGVSGDWRGELRPYVSLANIPERDLDFFIMLGDSIYADYPSIDLNSRQARSLSEFRIKHNEVYSNRFNKNYWASVRATTPLYAMIDDHEVANDFAGGASPSEFRAFAGDTAEFVNQTQLYRYGLQVFREYNPVSDEVYSDTNDIRFEGRPKLYRYIQHGQTAMQIILDARSFRDIHVTEISNIFNQAEIAQWNQDVWQDGRTMLGAVQLADLKRDLLDAHNKGILWKFIMMPEPVQQMGWLAGQDRWEGYAPERTEVLQFIEANDIQNVVFVSADIHTSFITDLTYQTEAEGELIQTNMWETSTGSVGFYPPTGQSTTEVARRFGLLLPRESAIYDDGDIIEKDTILETLFNRFVITTQGLNPLGIDNPEIDCEHLFGSWLIGHSFGWTEFDIDADTQSLLVTTYGIPAYSPNEIAINPREIINQEPQIVGQMRINPRR
ncbi:MAG: hypothetical protein Phog2KO_14010 [Phototrophicaceae bacterium]